VSCSERGVGANRAAASVFDRNGSGLNKYVPVVVIFPMSSVAVPIAFVIAVPICVIPIVIPTVLVSFRWK
jgi:hypothetical protein